MAAQKTSENSCKCGGILVVVVLVVVSSSSIITNEFTHTDKQTCTHTHTHTMHDAALHIMYSTTVMMPMFCLCTDM